MRILVKKYAINIASIQQSAFFRATSALSKSKWYGTVEWKCDMPHGTRADRRSGVVLLRSLARCATVHTPGRAAGRVRAAAQLDAARGKAAVSDVQ